MIQDFEDTAAMVAFKPAAVPKVLIVDDDPLVTQRLQALVEQAGFSARVAASGAAALATLRKHFASIVITDREMPDMDGVTLCRTIRDEYFSSYVYVILLTVQDAENDILEGLSAGGDDYVSKRASSAQLVARLRTAQRILNLEHTLRTVVEEKSRLATTDALTGSNNRRYFIRHLSRELRRQQRFGGCVSVLMLDIDHFKQVNDRYGHSVGDEVLQEFTRRIAGALVREVDWHARLGGEEFAVVLPQTNLAGARVVAQKLLTWVANKPIETSAGPLSITASIGAAGSELFAAPREATVDAVLEQADRCLYRSKDAGRNCATWPDAG